ncbi:MAG: DUF1574 domain-containing protein [Clostridia bacterium]|nr:DUF1574 domain-containing protein [Clostridia bacterium]
MSTIKKRILKVLAVIVAFVLTQNVLIWALKPINSAHWVKEDIRTYKNDVDTLIFGSSHVFCGFDPDLFDEKTNCVSFNFGSASQGIMDSYYYLLSCCRTFPNIKNVIVDVYFTSLIEKTQSDGEEMQRKIVLLDRLNDPIIKAHYIFESFSIDDLPWAFFNAFYFNNKKELAIKNVIAKLEPAYRHCDPDNPHLENSYAGRGFIPRHVVAEDDLGFSKEIELNYNIDKEAVEYLNKIVSFCKGKDINLIFIQMPMSETARREVASYRNFFNNEIERIAKENEIPYEDLNDSKYAFSDDYHFASSEHLCIQGAELATEYCAEILNDYINKK